ncbi:MAG: hypothetical protein WCR79_03215 [Fusobacterium sp.]
MEEKIEINEKILKKLEEKIIRLEIDNLKNKKFNDKMMAQKIKKYIEEEVPENDI